MAGREEEVTIPEGTGARGKAEMLKPEDVSVMVRLKALGWGCKRIASELGISPNTVRRYVEAGGYVGYKKPERTSRLDGREQWLRERLLRHGGNAEVVRQELRTEEGIEVSLRTVERAVEGYRQELEAKARATVRFETPPGYQLQVDFGEKGVEIAGERTNVHLCVLTLGYSRRTHVSVYPCERQAQWLMGIEAAFRYFGGVPEELLVDNARALVDRHEVKSGEVRFNRGFMAFCEHWGVRPRACAPYRARTKGKDERAVGYVKHNALAGRRFDSWAVLEGHLQWWMREVADVRLHGTTGEAPLARFLEGEVAALRPVGAHRSYVKSRELCRKVQSDCCVEVDTNSYSVPYRYLGRQVQVVVSEGWVRILLEGAELARHEEVSGSRQRVLEPRHLIGVVRGPKRGEKEDSPEAVSAATPVRSQESELQRPLSEYEAAAGGGR